MAESTAIDCEVAYARPDRQFVVSVRVPVGATVREALLQSGLIEQCPEIVVESAVFGVYGKVVPADCRVNKDDRVEIYRPLVSDPRAARQARVKESRRRR